MTGPTGILNRIDFAIERWERGPDAARWSPEPSHLPETFTEIRFDTVPAPPLGSTAIRMASEFQRFTVALSREERDDFTAYWQSGPWNLEQARERWAARNSPRPLTFAEAMENLRIVLDAAIAGVSELARELAREAEYSRAARDYRRRTKHRNRRRR